MSNSQKHLIFIVQCLTPEDEIFFFPQPVGESTVGFMGPLSGSRQAVALGNRRVQNRSSLSTLFLPLVPRFTKKVYRVEFSNFFSRDFVRPSVRSEGFREAAGFFVKVFSSNESNAITQALTFFGLLSVLFSNHLKKWFEKLFPKMKTAATIGLPVVVKEGDLVYAVTEKALVSISTKTTGREELPVTTTITLEFPKIIVGALKTRNNSFADLFILTPINSDRGNAYIQAQMGGMDNDELREVEMSLWTQTRGSRADPLYKRCWTAATDTHFKLILRSITEGFLSGSDSDSFEYFYGGIDQVEEASSDDPSLPADQIPVVNVDGRNLPVDNSLPVDVKVGLKTKFLERIKDYLKTFAGKVKNATNNPANLQILALFVLWLLSTLNDSEQDLDPLEKSDSELDEISDAAKAFNESESVLPTDSKISKGLKVLKAQSPEETELKSPENFQANTFEEPKSSESSEPGSQNTLDGPSDQK